MLVNAVLQAVALSNRKNLVLQRFFKYTFVSSRSSYAAPLPSLASHKRSGQVLFVDANSVLYNNNLFTNKGVFPIYPWVKLLAKHK